MAYLFFAGEGMHALSQLLVQWWEGRRSGKKEVSRLEMLFDLPFPPLLLASGRVLDTADANMIARAVHGSKH